MHKSVALMSYKFDGESIVHWIENFTPEKWAEINALPHLYTATSVIKSGNTCTPVGGVIIASSRPKNDPGLLEDADNCIRGSTYSKDRVSQATGAVLYPSNCSGKTSDLAEHDLLRMALDCYTMCGRMGSA